MVLHKKTNRRKFIKKLIKLGLFLSMPFQIKSKQLQENCEITTNDIQGPFYIENSPNISILTPPSINSNFLFITGTVYANDCITPIPNAAVDVWHANQGEYDPTSNVYLNSDYEDTFYRAKIYTDSNGNYAYQTILPGKYLNGNYYRPSHIHYKSSYLDQNEITTQLYFAGDSSIELDPWASNPSAEDRIINLSTDGNNNLNGVFDITLDVDPTVVTTNIQETQKIITAIYPNPINNTTHLYLNRTDGKILIQICDINGKVIHELNNLYSTKIPMKQILPKNIKHGVYILRIGTEKGFFDAKRFII